MQPLALITLGSVQLLRQSTPLTGFESDKVRALLIYLAIERDRPWSRTHLATLLWPHMPESRARTNLRQALSNLRATLGDRTTQPPFLHITPTTLQWASTAPCTVDYWSVTAALQQLPNCGPHSLAPSSLEQTLHLYAGDFLAQFHLADAPEFEEWQRARQTHLQQRYLAGLDCLADLHLAQQNFAPARQWSERQLQILPTHEPAHRRLMQLHLHAGDQSAAAAQFATCRALLHQHLRVEPAAETWSIYHQVQHAPPLVSPSASGGETRPATSPKPNPPASAHHLPPYTTPCLGRDALAASLINQLTAPFSPTPLSPSADSARLLVLLGPGGMGKTRLAVEVLHRIYRVPQPPSYSAWFMTWADLETTAQVWMGLAHCLGIALTDGETPERQVLAWLADREILLLLDNLDSVEQAASLIQTLLEQAPRLRILATARHRLHLRAETVHELSGLQVPPALLAHAPSTTAHSPPSPSDSADALAASPAVDLFLRTAQRNRPGFRLDAQRAPHVAAICRLVEGMPLALELAAGWVRTHSCAEIHAALGQNLDLLAAPLHDLPPRHRSIRATLNGSWLTLTPGVQTVLRRMGVLHGTFDAATALAVTGADPIALHTLRAAALIRLDAHDRYSLHELLRQFAHEKLRAGPDYTFIQQEHARWFAQRLVAAGPVDSLPPTAMEMLLHDLPNLQAGARYVLAHGPWHAIATYIEHLGPLYTRLNHHHDARDLYAQAVARVDATVQPPPQSSADLAPTDLAPTDPPPTAAQHARWQRLLGEACYRLGLLPDSCAHIDRGLATLDAKGAQILRRGRLAHLAGLAGELVIQARTRLGFPRRLPAAMQPVATEAAHAYERLGQIYYFDGRPLSSFYTALRGLNLAEGANATAILSRLHANLALAAALVPLHSLARHYSRLAETNARRSGNPQALIWALELCGMYALGVGNWTTARTHAHEAAELAQQWGDRRRWEENMALLASVDQAQGKLERACHQWQALAQEAHSIGHRQVQAWGMSGEAECLLLLGDPAGAKSRLLKSLVIHQDDGDRPSQASDHGSLALACWQLGEHAHALDWGQRALQLFAQCEPTAITAREGYCALAQLFVLAVEVRGAGQPHPWANHPWADALTPSELDGFARQALKYLNQFARVFPIAQPRAAVWRGRWLLQTQSPRSAQQSRRIFHQGRVQALRLHMPHEVEYIDRICASRSLFLHLNAQMGD